MTDLFQSYENDFELTFSEIQDKISQVNESPADQQRPLLTAAERAVDEAKEILDQMAIEVQNIPSSNRGPCNAKLRKHRTDVDSALKQIRSLVDSTDRRALFGDRHRQDAGSPENIALDQRQQLLSGQASLERSSQRLRDSQRIANETESIGANILTDLRGQREQIVNSRNTLMEADSYVDKSIRTLRGMARRMATNRIITIAIIVVLLFLIILVIASKFW